jgi:hypothetical protein
VQTHPVQSSPTAFIWFSGSSANRMSSMSLTQARDLASSSALTAARLKVSRSNARPTSSIEMLPAPTRSEERQVHRARRRCSSGSHHAARGCCCEAHAIARAIPRQLAQSRVAMAPAPAPRLLVVVRLSSEGRAKRWPRTAPLPSRRLPLRSWSSSKPVTSGLGGCVIALRLKRARACARHAAAGPLNAPSYAWLSARSPAPLVRSSPVCG